MDVPFIEQVSLELGVDLTRRSYWLPRRCAQSCYCTTRCHATSECEHVRVWTRWQQWAKLWLRRSQLDVHPDRRFTVATIRQRSGCVRCTPDRFGNLCAAKWINGPKPAARAAK